MATLQELITEIDTIENDGVRADKYIVTANARRIADDNATATTLLDEARDIAITLPVDTGRDYLASQIAFEYANAGANTKAQNAINAINDATIADEARGRIAIEIIKTDTALANSIIGTITDATIKDNTLSACAIERAKLNDLDMAITIRDTIADANLRLTTKYRIIDEIARSLQ